MKLIPLTKGYFAQVDDEDYSQLIKYKWQVQINHYQSRSIYYAARSIKDENGKRQLLFMHQVVLGGRKEGFVSDHIDFDGLNNTRNNLRYLTHRNNLIHSPKRTTPFVEKTRKKRSTYSIYLFTGLNNRWELLKTFSLKKDAVNYSDKNINSESIIDSYNRLLSIVCDVKFKTINNDTGESIDYYYTKTANIFNTDVSNLIKSNQLLFNLKN